MKVGFVSDNGTHNLYHESDTLDTVSKLPNSK